MKKNESCCGCDDDLQKEVKEIVNEVEGHTKASREKKGREVRAAFGLKKKTKKAEK